MLRSYRPARPCPTCGLALTRIPRLGADRRVRDPATGRSMRRYRCAGATCGWQGLLPPRSYRLRPAPSVGAALRPAADAGVPARPWWTPRLLRVVLGWSVAALAAGAGSQLVQHVLVSEQSAARKAGQKAARQADAARRAAPPPAEGESHDGVPLAARHPWLRPVSLPIAAAGGPALPADALQPLALRRDCAWGQPGRNPYRGGVEQALLHARLPLEVVRDIGRQVREHRPADRLQIRSGRIHGVAHGAEFDPRGMAMAFGNTLCLNTRVNFPRDHVEGADLYLARDARGVSHAVMVPDVCGNVTVLGVRGEKRPPPAVLLAAAPPDEQPWHVLATGADPTDPADPSDPAPVPEPGTLAVSALALAVVWALRRRRR